MMKKWMILPLAATVLAAPALAQQPRAPGPVPVGAEPARPDFAAMQARYADDLAMLLDLTPAQRPALDAFLKADRPAPPPGRGPGDAGPAKPPAGATPPDFLERLQHQEAMEARHGEATRARIAAAKAFYTQLTPRQRARFEALDRVQHRPGPGGPHGPGPGGPHGPGPGPQDGPGGPGGPEGPAPRG